MGFHAIKWPFPPGEQISVMWGSAVIPGKLLEVDNPIDKKMTVHEMLHDKVLVCVPCGDMFENCAKTTVR